MLHASIAKLTHRLKCVYSQVHSAVQYTLLRKIHGTQYTLHSTQTGNKILGYHNSNDDDDDDDDDKLIIMTYL